MLHGRFSSIGQPANWIVVDICRVEDGVLVEHWDVIWTKFLKWPRPEASNVRRSIFCHLAGTVAFATGMPGCRRSSRT